MTDEDHERIMRIFGEATGHPPKRAYEGDVIFLVGIIWDLLKKLEGDDSDGFDSE